MSARPRSAAPPDRARLVATDASAQEARAWLDKMNRAVEDLNYQGTFVHVLNGTPETLRIIHRNEAGRSGERIVSLDGVGREIIRQGDEVQCILPDQRVVLLEERKDISPLVSALPSYSAEIEPHYALNCIRSLESRTVTAQILEIKPRDEFRYGYMLWLDQETAMPLKSQLIDDQGRDRRANPVHENRPQDVRFPPQAIDATIDTTGFTMLRPPESSPARRRHTVACRESARRLQAVGRDAESRSRARSIRSSISSTPTGSRPCRFSSRTRTRRPRSGKAFRRWAAPTRFR